MMSPVDGGGVILKETTPTRIKMFHRSIKTISQKNVMMCGDAFF